MPLYTSGDKSLTKFVFKKLDFYIDHDTEAINLCNVGTLCNKKSAIYDMRAALCDVTIYFVIRMHYVIWVCYVIWWCAMWNGCAMIVNNFI